MRGIMEPTAVCNKLMKELVGRLEKKGHVIENSKVGSDFTINRIDEWNESKYSQIVRLHFAEWKGAYELSIRNYKINNCDQVIYSVTGKFDLAKIASRLSEVAKHQSAQRAKLNKQAEESNQRQDVLDRAAKKAGIVIPDYLDRDQERPLVKSSYLRTDFSFDVHLNEETELEIFLKAIKQIADARSTKNVARVLSSGKKEDANVIKFPG